MRWFLFLVPAMAFAAAGNPALAAAADISSELGIVSDYRFRGISLSEGKPAVQASFQFEAENGLFGALWASSIGNLEQGPDLELDVSAGYSAAIVGKLRLEASGTYYIYPGDPGANYAETNFAAELGDDRASLRAGLSWSPRQSGTRDEAGERRANLYLFAGAAYRLPQLPLSLSAEVGREKGAFDERVHGAKWDWRLGAELERSPLRAGLSWCGSNAAGEALVASLMFDW